MPEDSYFLYLLTLKEKYENPASWTDETLSVLESHGKFLADLGKEGKLLFAGRTDYNPGDENLFGIALIKASSKEEAVSMMSKDPAIIYGIQKSEIHPYRLAIEFFENKKASE